MDSENQITHSNNQVNLSISPDPIDPILKSTSLCPPLLLPPYLIPQNSQSDLPDNQETKNPLATIYKNRSKSDPKQLKSKVWKGFIQYYFPDKDFQILKKHERLLLLASVVKLEQIHNSQRYSIKIICSQQTRFLISQKSHYCE